MYFINQFSYLSAITQGLCEMKVKITGRVGFGIAAEFTCPVGTIK